MRRADWKLTFTVLSTLYIIAGASTAGAPQARAQEPALATRHAQQSSARNADVRPVLPEGTAEDVSPAAQSTPGGPAPVREKFEKSDVLYDWVSNSRGDRLRTFVTKPKGTNRKVPVIVFVGWLSCDSVEYAKGETDGFGAFIRRVIDQSGYATLRMDKPGVGESTGTPCAKADFTQELEGYQAAFDSMRKYDFIDMDQVFVLGMSNGGGVGPLVSRQHPVRGFVALVSWGRTWYEHMLELERRRLTAGHKTPGDITEQMKVFARFYDDYLIRGMTPGEILREHADWKAIWYDSPDGQYGRPAAFYQQLQALNLGRAWQSTTAPVFVIGGSGDMIMSHADTKAIADSVNHAHPGQAQYLEVDGMGHDLTVNNRFHDELVPIVLGWMKKTLGSAVGTGNTPRSK